MILKVFVYNPFRWDEPVSYLALAIRVILGVFHNHAGIVRKKLDGKWYIVQAVGNGVTEEDYYTWLAREERGIILKPLESNFSEEELQLRTDAEIGKKYDKPGLVKILLYTCTGIWIKSKDEYVKEMCYKMVAHVEGKPDAMMARPAFKIIKHETDNKEND